MPTWTRDGGLRWTWLARCTRGRYGLGRWTQAEVDSIRARGRVEAAFWADLADDA